jgi:hypothetical protein
MSSELPILILGIALLLVSIWQLHIDTDRKVSNGSLYGYNFFYLIRGIEFGIIIILITLSGLLNLKFLEIWIVLLVLGTIETLVTLLVLFSDSANKLVWKFVPKGERASLDRKWLAMALALGAFGFFFCTYLFSPYFLHA